MPISVVRAPAIHCERCKATIESAVGAMPGVTAVHADLASKTVTVMWDDPQTWAAAQARLAELGYPGEPLHKVRRHVAIVLYDGFTALDAVGPYEVLVSLPDTRVHFVADRHGPVLADTGQLALVATKTWEELPDPAVIVIPGGGAGLMKAAENQRLLAWLRQAHATAEWTASVCTGAFILGVAGLLQGLTVTTHWGSAAHIAGYCGATYAAERFVQQGTIVTAAGVSAGIDMALFIAAQLGGELTARAIQLACEYDPQPPFDAGRAAGAAPELIAEANRVIQSYRMSS
jgi:transcriptional regulator GlxA family with amidase domain/copper chaperone CopZ